MALEIKVKDSKWADIKLVCACSHDNKVPFRLEEQSGLIMMKCNNEECDCMYPSEIHLKALTDIEKWFETHETLEGFTSFFKRTIQIPRKLQNGFTTVSREKCSVRLKYIKTIQATKNHSYHLIEIANLTLYPETKEN